jgi:hypothetical protein
MCKFNYLVVAVVGGVHPVPLPGKQLDAPPSRCEMCRVVRASPYVVAPCGHRYHYHCLNELCEALAATEINLERCPICFERWGGAVRGVDIYEQLALIMEQAYPNWGWDLE